MTLLGYLSAYCVVRMRQLSRFAILALCMTPAVFPGLIVAVAYYGSFTAPPVNLYGTYLVMALAFCCRFVPIAFLNSDAAIRSIDEDQERSARIHGATPRRVLKAILLPLSARHIWVVWALTFVASTSELSTALFLSTSNTKVISVTLLDFMGEGRIGLAAALGVIQMSILLVVMLLGSNLSNKWAGGR